jgi:hypothetical protein
MAEMAYQQRSKQSTRNAVNQQRSGRVIEDNRAAFKEAAQLKENKTGLPDNLKSGIENLSGMSMDHVKVHYNSSKPAQLSALAYAQGSDIHVAPGQEKHVPHEAWHVVQQAQGRVKPTKQMKTSTVINDDPHLENEASVMGARAIQQTATSLGYANNSATDKNSNLQGSVIQRVVYKRIKGQWRSISNKETKGKYALPEVAKDNTFFNDENGLTGEEIDDVQEKKSPYDDTPSIFKELLQIIIDDDKEEYSEIDPLWKQQVIKNRNNEEILIDLKKEIKKSYKPEENNIEESHPKFGHGEIGTFNIDDKINEKRLQTEPDLLSLEVEKREKAVKTIRGTDEVHTSYQGAILREFIFEERRAILGLVEAASDASAVFSLERGGAMIADLMEKLARGKLAPNIKIPKPKKKDVQLYLEKYPLVGKSRNIEETTSQMLENPANQKQVHADMFKFFIKQFIEKQKDEHITIAIAETAVGGGSVNSLLKTVNELCEELKSTSSKKVKFKVLVARETIKNSNYKGSGILKIHDPVNIVEGKGIKSNQVLETDNPNEVEVFISQTRYLIGEDVDYQLQYSGGLNSDKPVIVFEGSGENLTALSIEPASEGDSARDIIIDLVGGAYDKLMGQIFAK